MSVWRRVAIEKFPHLHRAVADADNAGYVWHELWLALQKVYRQIPLDEAFAADVYEYASWCLHHRHTSLRRTVILWFYDYLACDNFTIRSDMARWMSQEDFDILVPEWATFLTDENLKAFRKEFAARKAIFQENASRNQ